jgi:hypothetical protein
MLYADCFQELDLGSTDLGACGGFGTSLEIGPADGRVHAARVGLGGVTRVWSIHRQGEQLRDVERRGAIVNAEQLIQKHKAKAATAVAARGLVLCAMGCPDRETFAWATPCRDVGGRGASRAMREGSRTQPWTAAGPAGSARPTTTKTNWPGVRALLGEDHAEVALNGVPWFRQPSGVPCG